MQSPVSLLVTAAALASAVLCSDDDSRMHPQAPYGRERAGAAVVGRAPGPTEEQVAKYWYEKSLKQIESQLARRQITSTAKNLILFLGDGMSVPTLAATRVYLGGENSELSFDKFPSVGLSKTYCVDTQVADSACSSTAYLCGVKANQGTMGLTAAAPRDYCEGQMNTTNHVDSILAWAQKANKSTGIVTTTRITHASPGGTYAHIAERNWENDQKVVDSGYDPETCKDIAKQLVMDSPGKDINVILGGGRREFLNNTESAGDENGNRQDGLNLIDVWKANHSEGVYVADRDSLLEVDTNSTDYLLGLFDASHILYHLDNTNQSEPSLAEMTTVAIEILSKNPEGFYLFVEGGRIDHGHHDALAHYALDETKEFSEAIQAAVNMTSEDDTLIVVTADHAHTMSLAGYAQRGTDIFGYAGTSDEDDLPYTTLVYGNGPGYKTPVNGTRPNPKTESPAPNETDYQFPGAVPLSSETHGGDDVGIFARGPWSHLFSGVLEQSTIPHIMAYAARIGLYADYNATSTTEAAETTTTSTATAQATSATTEKTAGGSSGSRGVQGNLLVSMSVTILGTLVLKL